jgi:ClpP class serine protease
LPPSSTAGERSVTGRLAPARDGDIAISAARVLRPSSGYQQAVMVIFWLVVLALVVIAVLLPVAQRRQQLRRRRALLRAFEKERGSRVITLIHRQEGISLLGFSLGRYISIEDSEQVLRAIRLTPADVPIDLILHTPGGLVLASDQIAYALRRHRGPVTVFVPHYAMSGGTLVALAADKIIMDRDAVLGPVDPQLGGLPHGFWPAASILKALQTDNPNRSDETLILGDMAGKAIAQLRETVSELLTPALGDAKAGELASLLSGGTWTHDFPIRLDYARELGLPVSDEMPTAIYDLMAFYPQRGRRPSVEFVPGTYPEPDEPKKA